MRSGSACRKGFHVWLSFTLLTGLIAQQPADWKAAATQSLNAVKTESLRHPAAFGWLSELSDRIGPRLTGSPQEERAGQWALETMRGIGLQNVHPEPWTLEQGWRRGYARCQLIQPFPLELIVTSYGWTGSTPTRNAEAEVVLVDSGALAEETRKNAAGWAGKVLLVAPKDPKHSDAMGTLTQLPAFLSAAEAADAIAVIIRDRRPGTALVHTGPVSFPMKVASMAVLDIAREQEEMLTRILNSGAAVRVKIEVVNEFTEGAVTSHNIVGEIPGSQHPEEVVVLGGHLDSWDLGAGSIDDGFGVAAVLGAARSIVASGVEPHRTIRFVLFTGEEQGLLGSRAYVQAHQNEMKNVVCAWILDWGNGPITKFPLGGHSELAAPLEELVGSIRDVALVQITNGYLTYTDAYAFTLAGVPAIAPLQDSADYTLVGHSAADTLDKVSPEVLTKNSGVLALAAVWVADYPSRIGSVWPPEKTAQALQDQRDTLRALGLWPFRE
jgi:carboxypeptidase Q